MTNIIVDNMEEIKLSGPEFKALASETRAGIIKLLRGRNHTLTEMSKKLKLAAPTVKQHLGILEKADLIEELDEGRKWKYYRLTRKSKNIFLHQTPINVFIVLGVSLFALVGLLYSFISMVENQAMSFAVKGGQMFMAPGVQGIVPAAAESSKTILDAMVSTTGAGEAVAEAVANDTIAGVVAKETVTGAITTSTPFSFEMIVMLFGIVSIAVLAGYLIAKTKN